MLVCASCQTFTGFRYGLCGGCWALLADYRSPAYHSTSGLVIYSPYVYDGIVKGLVRRAKVEDLYYAKAFVEQLMLFELVVLGVYPKLCLSPRQSSRSQWLGKFDIAAGVAKAWSKRCGARFDPQGQRRFQLRPKRSKMAGRWQPGDICHARRPDLIERLLIDDVVTTGQTLLGLLSNQPATSVLAVCLARSKDFHSP